MLAALAWKNIWRNKTRSMVVTIAVAVGMFGGIFFTAFMKGLVHQRLKSAIENECSDIQIHNPDYLLHKETSDTITGASSILHALDTMKALSAVSARIKIVAMAASANSSQSVTVSGIDVGAEKSVTGICKCIADSMGTYLTEGTGHQVVIGYQMAKKLKLKLKSKIILTFPADSGTIVSTACRVCGIYKTNNSTFDASHVFVKKAELASLSGLSANSCHEIGISVRQGNESERIAQRLQQLFPTCIVRPWSEVMPELAVLSSKSDAVLYILMTIILLALSFGIINTMLMAVLDRTREIGMLMAVGMSKYKVFSLILFETVLLLCTGTALGIAAAMCLVSWLSVKGIDLSALSQGLEEVGFSAVVYPFMAVADYITVVVLVVVTGFLASVVPARRALQLDPATAIREV